MLWVTRPTLGDPRVADGDAHCHGSVGCMQVHRTHLILTAVVSRASGALGHEGWITTCVHRVSSLGGTV